MAPAADLLVSLSAIYFDSVEVLQKQAFLEPPDFCGGAPRWSTVIVKMCHPRGKRASRK
jgi:hypothetical protein